MCGFVRKAAFCLRLDHVDFGIEYEHVGSGGEALRRTRASTSDSLLLARMGYTLKKLGH